MRGYLQLRATCAPGQIDVGWGCGEQTQAYTGPSTSPTMLPAGTVFNYGPSVPGAAWQQVGTQLDPAVRAWLAARGLTLDCKEVCDEVCLAQGMSPCCSTQCSVDGSAYDYSAGLINANPNTLLVDLGMSPAVTTSALTPTAIPTPGSGLVPTGIMPYEGPLHPPASLPPAGPVHAPITQPRPTPPGEAAGPQFMLPAFLTKSAFNGFPVWGVIAAVAGGLFLFGGRR